MQLTQHQHRAKAKSPYCIAEPAVAPVYEDAASTVWSKEAGMSGADGSPLVDDAGPSGMALERNKTLVAQVRAMLAEPDVQGFAALIEHFSELLEDCGPLGYLRFTEQTFSTLVSNDLGAAVKDVKLQQRASGVPDGDDSLPDMLCDHLHAKLMPVLASRVFIDLLRSELEGFLAQPFVPREDRLAACAALLATPPSTQPHELNLLELPVLYAIFRLQLAEWLQLAGKRQIELLHAATQGSND